MEQLLQISTPKLWNDWYGTFYIFIWWPNIVITRPSVDSPHKGPAAVKAFSCHGAIANHNKTKQSKTVCIFWTESRLQRLLFCSRFIYNGFNQFEHNPWKMTSKRGVDFMDIICFALELKYAYYPQNTGDRFALFRIFAFIYFFNFYRVCHFRALIWFVSNLAVFSKSTC